MARLDELIAGARGRIRDRQLAALVERGRAARRRPPESKRLEPVPGDVFVQEVHRFDARWYNFFKVVAVSHEPDGTGEVAIQPVGSRDLMRTVRRGTADAASSLVVLTDAVVGPVEKRSYKTLRLPRRPAEVVVMRGADELYQWDGEPLVEINP